MKIEKILQNGKMVAEFVDGNGETRYLYEYRKCYASCVAGGLKACFEDRQQAYEIKREMKTKL